MVTSIVKGLWTALKNPKLVLLLWAWNLLLALAAIMPARAWFGGALNTATETGTLLTRFNFGAFADLSKYNDVAPFGLLVSTMVGIGLVALVGNAFMNGGMVEIVGNRSDARTFMHRFFRGGGHFFWRFVRLDALALAVGAVVVGLVSAAMGAATAPLSDSEWEPAGMFWGLVTVVVAGLFALLFVLALDYARIQVAREGRRGMFRTYLGALGFVLRHPVGTYGIAVTYLALTGVCLLAYVAHEASWTTSTWAAIWVLLGVQQIIILARTGLRVMEVGAEWAYVARVTPDPVAVPLVARAVAPVVVEERLVAGSDTTPGEPEANSAAVAVAEGTPPRE